jgi:hypothetical protein
MWVLELYSGRKPKKIIIHIKETKEKETVNNLNRI